MRIVPTPLAAALPAPVPRGGGVSAALLDAIVVAPGIEPMLERLRHPETLIVTTGQQPGLFTGPLYTVYKALSAAALAGEMERRWGLPVVPVFWLANDDHDYAEARSSSWLGTDGELVTAALSDRPAEAPQTPMYRLPLGPEVVDQIRLLEQTTPDSPARVETLDWLLRHYTTGATVGRAFGGALAELLAPLGIVCIDSTHPAVKRSMVPLLIRALEQARALEKALTTAAEVYLREGREPPVPIIPGASLVFLETSAGRERIVVEDGTFVARRSGTRYSAAEIRRIADTEPDRLSPNVLLRPVVESEILPSVAYVAGPGELAYLGMCAPLYDELGVIRQVPVPRWSGVLVEPRVDRILAKYGATLDELLVPGNALETRVVRSQLPADLIASTSRLREGLEREYAIIQAGAVGIDPTLERPAAAARQAAMTGVAEIEKKVEQHLKKREAVELAQIGRARTAVLPAGKPQERVLTVAGWLARQGRPFLAELAESIKTWYASALAGAADRS
jgi:bacillithiol biosynthesis cysteine-adding enzyme BshC